MIYVYTEAADGIHTGTECGIHIKKVPHKRGPVHTYLPVQ